MTKYQFYCSVGCTVASLFIIANIAANHTSVLPGVLAIAITAYGWGWHHGKALYTITSKGDTNDQDL